MAQTKTTQKKRAAPKRSKGSQRSRSSNSGSTKARKQSSSSSNGSRKSTPQVAQTVKAAEQKAKNAGQSVGKAASKAKVPLIASGAAVAGAAGGMALAATRKNRPRWAGVRKPLFKVSSHDVANAAKEVGNFGAEVGKLASELQRNREAANGHGHSRPRRSPIEVVLQGLTQRR